MILDRYEDNQDWGPVTNQQYFLKYEAPRTHEGGGDGCVPYFYWWLRGINTPRREGGKCESHADLAFSAFGG